MPLEALRPALVMSANFYCKLAALAAVISYCAWSGLKLFPRFQAMISAISSLFLGPGFQKAG